MREIIMFLKKFTVCFFGFLSGLLCFSALSAQEVPDTLKTYPLQEVEIRSSSSSSFKASAPVQTLNVSVLDKIGALQVSDAVKHFAGVQVKDYGGVGGLKTVSLRGLGAGHTNVSYDGISVSDYQTGQIDLGRFSTDNIERITLNIGESDDIFQPAQLQSLAGVLNIVTQTFFSENNKKQQIKASLKGGSFGLLNPSFAYDRLLNNTFTSSVSADYLQTEGNYPFTQTIGYLNATTQNRIRNNSDVKNLKLEGNLNGKFNKGGRLALKAYAFQTNRGLPGPAVYYNDYSKDRLKDRNFFIQAHYQQALHKKTDFQANTKFNFMASDYDNGRQYLYYQREYYLDAVVRHRFSDKWSLAWANDEIYGNMNSNIFLNIPSRTTWLSAFSGKYEIRQLDITAKLLYTYAKNNAENEQASNAYNHFSPYLGFSLNPVKNIPLRLRGFFKNSFRMPTLSDIYYSPLSRKNLKPEKARQYNLGLVWASELGKMFPYFSFSGDAYRNDIKDKIIAYPTSDMNFWTMMNIGVVEIKGFDMKGEIHIRSGEKFLWKINGTYTFQQVLNKTNPGNADYNKQIPYTPRYAASGWLSLEMPWLDVSYTMLYSGKRYSEASNRPETQMKRFAEQGIILSRNILWKAYRGTVSAECINLSDKQYEIVRSYPMQGRSFRVAIKFIY
jgi:outer membrane cobalamin receptor